jgi:solute carrier family 35, member F5
MALLGALCYGLYTTLLKVRIGHESRIDMPKFLGFVGVFNVLALWPGLPLLDYTGIEKFELPGSEKIWWFVAVCVPNFSPNCLGANGGADRLMRPPL